MKKCINIYRIEKDGKGPYTDRYKEPSNLQEILRNMAIEHNDKSHPSPEEDGIDMRNFPKALFGFTSMRKLHKWFGQWVPILKEIGYEIKIYKNPKIMKLSASKRQVVFIP